MQQPAVERERGGSKCDGDGDGDRECCAPPSRDLVATALVLAAEAAAALIADDAIGGNRAARGACLPFLRITCMLNSAVVVRCFDGQAA